MYSEKKFVVTRGLISYGANIPSLFGRAAEMADKNLKGAKPADIPVEQPTKFEESAAPPLPPLDHDSAPS